MSLAIASLLALGVAPALAASPGPDAAPGPVCGDGTPPSWVTVASNPNDGIPDPAGRIVFGQDLRDDPTFGPLVKLYAIDSDGSDLVQLLDCEVAYPHISPDGRQVAFGIHLDNGSMQAATMAIDGTDLRILTSGGYDEYPDWSPDGTWLVYSHVSGAEVAEIDRECPISDCLATLELKEQLWRMNADGSDQRLIGDPDGTDFWPRLSPDAREVVFARLDPANDHWKTLMIRDLATGAERQVTANDREPVLPQWSSDGRSILYATMHPAGHPEDISQQVETVPADDPTATPTVIRAEAAGGGGHPSYSPDGTRIVFFGCGGGLCTMAADGSDVQPLFSAPGVVPLQPNWGILPEPAG